MVTTEISPGEPINLSKDFTTSGYWDILEIEEFMFRGKYERIGADCWGVGGPCAHSKGGKCGEFVSCQAANRAMIVDDADEIIACPLFVDLDESWRGASLFYEKVKNLDRFRNIDDKDSRLKHRLIDLDGEPLEPDEVLEAEDERSTQRLEWYQPSRLQDALLLIDRRRRVNMSRVGDEWEDQSEFELPSSKTIEDLSSRQREILIDFRREHNL
ncbi:hypothetical protein HYW55_06175 [Candidatus Gottesmanbacteria bacterium]|nr:hypothetical protein [Candidatus Gottesmanbacteria bacterium]